MTQMTPGQALFVIEKLVQDKVVKRSVVERIAAQMDSEIKALEIRLSILRGENRPISRGPRAAQATSAATQASRRLQGQYLGLIRQIPASQRKPFKAIAKTKGREEAVRQLRRALANKSR